MRFFQNRIFFITIAALIVLFSFEGSGCCELKAGEKNKEDIRHFYNIVSDPLTIDRVHRSMSGPADTQVFRIIPSHKAVNQNHELIWLTGMKTQILDAETFTPQSQEYLCHITLAAYNRTEENENMLDPTMRRQYPKILALFQSQTEFKFPENFAMPAKTEDPFFLASMVVNNNEVPEKPFQLNVKNSIEYVYDHDVTDVMNPLFRRNYILKVPVKDEEGTLKELTEDGAHCMFDPAGESIAGLSETSKMWLEKDAEGNVLANHWMVPPGRHVYRYRLPRGLEISYDTTVHYIGTHLHAFGEYMALNDLTTHQTVYKANVKNYKDRKGIEESDVYSSQDGFLLYKDHDYELVCEYNNTTSENVDSMCMMLVFYLNKEFDKSQFLSKK